MLVGFSAESEQEESSVLRQIKRLISSLIFLS